MLQIPLEQGVALALDATQADRLALLCGAGLSMASPSNIPGAFRLAADAKRKYDAMYGPARAPLPVAIEEQAEFFFQRGELGTVYLRTLVDQHVFSGPPNDGHRAAADLLLVGAIQTAVTTNVDQMIETAGQMLFGRIGVGTDRIGVAALPPDTSPLLKIHGCWFKDPDHTVWAPGQLTADPVASRIAGSEEWLSVRLLDRDLIVVGYFTDWDYLNAVLERALLGVRPARVIVVDPDETGALAAKAPALYALGSRATSAFHHVRSSGAVFLDQLRAEFSRSFVRRMLHSGADLWEEMTGNAASPHWREPVPTDSESLWLTRRDLEGCLPNQPGKLRTPPDEPTVGLTIVQLQAAGATAEGPHWLLNGRRIRVLRTPNQPLHRVESAYQWESAPVIAPDVVVAVGAEASALPPSIVRSSGSGTIARGTTGRWFTRQDAVPELGL